MCFGLTAVYFMLYSTALQALTTHSELLIAQLCEVTM